LYYNPNNVSHRVLGPGTIYVTDLGTHFRENTKNEIFEQEFLKHRKSMIVGVQNVLGSRYSSQNFEMTMTGISVSYNTDNDSKPISSTGGSTEGILRINNKLNRDPGY
jgi:hypothetical protein